MPLQNPSPHRFIAPVPTSQSPKPKPKSNLRHVVGLNTPEVPFKKITPAKRFVLASTRREHGRGNSTRHMECVAEGGEAQTGYDGWPRVGEYDEVNDDMTPSVGHTILPSSAAVDEQEDEEDDLLFDTHPAPKRRRTSPPPHRFRAPPPPPTHSANPQRPSFILPAPRSPRKPTAQNLPEIFSPSRKAQKYTPHGLAASVQAWIVDAAQQGSAGGMVWGREREEGVRVKIKVEDLGGCEGVDCWGGGVVFVGGEMEGGMDNASWGEGEGVKVVLAGVGGSRGTAAVKIRVGSVVGVRAPMWEVDVGGETWVVGVEWVVLC